MRLALIADDKKKELMTQFCIAYCGILSKHDLCTTSITGKYIEDATGLKLEKVMPGTHGGIQQIVSRVSCDEIDMVIYMRDPTVEHRTETKEVIENLLRLCDLHSVPAATNIATAEMLINGLDRGDLDWRDNTKNALDF